MMAQKKPQNTNKHLCMMNETRGQFTWKVFLTRFQSSDAHPNQRLNPHHFLNTLANLNDGCCGSL